MEIQIGPNAIDEPNILYTQQRKIKVFETNDPLPNKGYNLVTSSSKYGLVFVAVPNGTLSVYQLNQLVDKESDPLHVSIKLNEIPTHIACSCDQELLLVTGGQLLSFFRVVDFQNQNVSPILSIKTDVDPSTFVSSLQWNFCVPESVAIAFYNGTLLACNVNNGQVKKVPSKARCICWSPKGKQLVTGNSDGTLCQYKPDLTLAKTIPAPNLFNGAMTEILAVYWISTYQFAVVYKNANENSRPAVTIINTPKAGQSTCVNYEDVCYSMGTNRPYYYYLLGIPIWNLILASSSNSMELATLGSKDGSNWIQWSQPDEARPDLPLTDEKQESYPVGVCIDTCGIHQLPWGENEVLPHMPLLHIVSQSGLLTTFNIINLNKDSAPVCTAPQLLTLPADTMTREIVNDNTTSPAQVQANTMPIQQKVETTQQSVISQYVPLTSQFSAIQNVESNNQSGQTNQTFTPASPVQFHQQPSPPQYPMAQQKRASETQTASQIQENAALMAEQERLNKLKANQELNNMLIKEVNDFQMELYKFTLKTRETQARLQRDIESINANFNVNLMDAEQLKKECSLDELKADIVQLKLELVRACAVIAEAKTYAETKDDHQWSLTDPLTSKRVASVKKLAYYVQTQLCQAQKALDYKWKEIESRDPNLKPGQRMIRPILDDIYQPLVKQQEILSQQRAVLHTLRNTLNQCDIPPKFKSTMIRSTPLKNKEPLTKLTKKILNMNIESKPKQDTPQLTSQKLDALRDFLSNHKTIKIKPVNVELRQQLANMKISYEESLKEKEIDINSISSYSNNSNLSENSKIEMPAQFKFEPPKQPTPAPIVKVLPKPAMVKPSPFSAPSFTPVNNNMKPFSPGIANVARTLFVDDEPPKPAQPTPQIQAPPKLVPLPDSPTDTRSVLKDLLQNKNQNVPEQKTENNIFNPTSTTLSFTPTTTSQAPVTTNLFVSKPLTGISNMFNKFQPQTFASDLKPAAKPKSEETGEPEASIATPKPFTAQNMNDKPLTNLFAMKPNLSFVASTPNVNVLKSNQQEVIQKTEKSITKPVEKDSEAIKENIPEKPLEANYSVQTSDMKENVKPFSTPTVSKESAPVLTIPQVTTASTPTSESKTTDVVKTEIKEDPPKSIDASDVTVNSSASSIFAAANATINTKQQPLFGTITTPSSEANETPNVETSSTIESPTNLSVKPVFAPAATTTTSSPSSIFGAAVASQPKPTTQTGSVFSTSPASSTSSIFGSPQGSLFGNTTTPSSLFGSTTTPSIFTGSSDKPSVFSTPTPASPASVFGTTTHSGTAFGQPATFGTTTTTQSIFGSGNTTVFGAPANSQSSVLPTTTASLVFGASTATTQAPVFGSSPTTAASAFSPTSNSSIFGSVTTTTSNLFSSAATTQASIFGSSGSSVFGSSTPSVFGAAQPSVFGTATAPSTSASVFGATTTTPSMFGGTQTTQASIFGAPPATTAQSGSLFGGAEANLFASASISTTSAPTQASGGNIFGGGSPGNSVFGSSNTNVFGGKSTFGQSNPTATSIFGGGASFGQKPASNFWSGGNTSGGAFGQPATTQSSLFGSGGGSFSSPGSAQPFGNPQPASAFGSNEATPSVFGTPPQQTAPAFGGSPFGSKPVFGQPAGTGFGSFGGFNKSPSGFGATASFGGGATFGGSAFGNTSPGKVFGGDAPSFASATQSNSTFENLATQNTLTFGNLAQQSGQPVQPAPSFNTSPSFTGWRG